LDGIENGSPSISLEESENLGVLSLIDIAGTALLLSDLLPLWKLGVRDWREVKEGDHIDRYHICGSEEVVDR
jgi:hypothetical protein